MELEKSVRMMERNVMAMEVTTFFFFFILIIPKAITLRITISLINILSIIVIIHIIIFIMDANCQPRRETTRQTTLRQSRSTRGRSS